MIPSHGPFACSLAGSSSLRTSAFAPETGGALMQLAVPSLEGPSCHLQPLSALAGRSQSEAAERRRNPRAGARMPVPVSRRQRKCQFPATFGPGQYLPAARTAMYGRCLRSAAVSTRAVRGLERRRVGRSTHRESGFLQEAGFKKTGLAPCPRLPAFWAWAYEPNCQCNIPGCGRKGQEAGSRILFMHGRQCFAVLLISSSDHRLLGHLLRRSSPSLSSPQAFIAFLAISPCRAAAAGVLRPRRRRQHRPSSYSQVETRSKVAGNELSWVSVASRGHLECTSFQEPSQSDRGRLK
jgi:hypothetical protein